MFRRVPFWIWTVRRARIHAIAIPVVSGRTWPELTDVRARGRTSWNWRMWPEGAWGFITSNRWCPVRRTRGRMATLAQGRARRTCEAARRSEVAIFAMRWRAISQRGGGRRLSKNGTIIRSYDRPVRGGRRRSRRSVIDSTWRMSVDSSSRVGQTFFQGGRSMGRTAQPFLQSRCRAIIWPRRDGLTESFLK